MPTIYRNGNPMIKQIVASINRHEELLLELIAERFQSRWQQATADVDEGEDAEYVAYTRGWNAAWDDAFERLNDIITNHVEGLDVKLELMDR